MTNITYSNFIFGGLLLVFVIFAFSSQSYFFIPAPPTVLAVTNPFTLLCSGSGSTQSATATNVATCAISGLTNLDSLVVNFSQRQDVAGTAYEHLTSDTDTVNLGNFSDGSTANESSIGEFVVRSSAKDSTHISTTQINSASTGGGSNNTSVTTPWTSAWTLGFKQGGVTATGTFYWSWAVYKRAGQ